MNLVLQPQTLARSPPPPTLFPASGRRPAVASPPSTHHRNRVLVPRPRQTPPLAATPFSAATNSVPPRNGVYTVGDFMTRREELHTVKPTTTVDKALEALVEYRITGFPVIDDDWKLDVTSGRMIGSARSHVGLYHLEVQPDSVKQSFLGVGVVSDYDLLALDSISGGGRSDASMFPEVDSTWKTFNEIQKLLSKTYGKVVGDLMTPAPLVVRETTNLEDAARLLLETKYRRLPVVDSQGKLVGIITRGNVVRAALQIKRSSEIHA